MHNRDDRVPPRNQDAEERVGNLTIQFFANLYLNRFDHYVKEKLHARYYIRYVDDFLIASNDIHYLRYALKFIDEYLISLRLKLHPQKCHILRTENGIKFLGQVIYSIHRLLDKKNVKRFCQRMNKMERQLDNKTLSRDTFNSSLQGWRGHAEQADTYHLRKDLQKKYKHLGVKLVGK